MNSEIISEGARVESKMLHLTKEETFNSFAICGNQQNAILEMVNSRNAIKKLMRGRNILSMC